MKARYEGTCPFCKQPISIGQEIKGYGGKWYHLECCERYLEERRQPQRRTPRLLKFYGWATASETIAQTEEWLAEWADPQVREWKVVIYDQIVDRDPPKAKMFNVDGYVFAPDDLVDGVVHLRKQVRVYEIRANVIRF
jgi:hypothetical protein